MSARRKRKRAFRKRGDGAISSGQTDTIEARGANEKRLAVWAVVVFLIAFAARLIVSIQLGKLPLSRTPQLDSFEYLTWGSRIARGHFTWPMPAPHGPGYPFFLGFVLAISGGSLVVVRVVQSFIGALTCWFTGATTRALFGHSAGISASAILAVYAPLIWIDSSLYAEGLLLCLLASFLWSIVTLRNWFVSAAILGSAVLVRPTALALLPIAVMFGTKTWRARAVLSAAVALVIAAIAISSWRTTGDFIPIQAYGGMNFYLGNSPFRDGLASARVGGDWDRIESDAARHGYVSPRDEDRYFIRKTFGEIQQHPLAYARLLLRKFVWTFQNEEVRETHSFYFFRQFSPILCLVPFTILFALAAAGAVAADWLDRGRVISGSYVLLTAATPMLLVVGSRYRMPLVIGLALFAGNAVAHRRSSRRTVVITIIVAITATLGTLLWRHKLSHNFAEEWAMTARSLQREGNDGAAEERARKATELDPQNALGFDSLGTALLAERKIADAARALERATILNPDFFDARLHLGRAYQAMNDPAKAEQEYFAAIRIDPRDARPLKWAAEAASTRGDLERAVALYSRAADLDPHDAYLMWSLARLEGAIGKPHRGLAFAQRAARLESPSPDQWVLTATLAIHARQFDVARSALQEARLFGADPIAVTFANSLLLYQIGDLDHAEQLINTVIQRAPNFVEGRKLKVAIEQKRQSVH